MLRFVPSGSTTELCARNLRKVRPPTQHNNNNSPTFKSSEPSHYLHGRTPKRLHRFDTYYTSLLVLALQLCFLYLSRTVESLNPQQHSAGSPSQHENQTAHHVEKRRRRAGWSRWVVHKSRWQCRSWHGYAQTSNGCSAGATKVSPSFLTTLFLVRTQCSTCQTVRRHVTSITRTTLH